MSTHLLNCTVLQHERVELQNSAPPPHPTSSYNFIDWQDFGTELISLHNCITVIVSACFMTVVSGMCQLLHYLFMVYLIIPSVNETVYH
jgi:hypothetical protein